MTFFFAVCQDPEAAGFSKIEGEDTTPYQQELDTTYKLEVFGRRLITIRNPAPGAEGPMARGKQKMKNGAAAARRKAAKVMSPVTTPIKKHVVDPVIRATAKPAAAVAGAFNEHVAEPVKHASHDLRNFGFQRTGMGNPPTLREKPMGLDPKSGKPVPPSVLKMPSGVRSAREVDIPGMEEGQVPDLDWCGHEVIGDDVHPDTVFKKPVKVDLTGDADNLAAAFGASPEEVAEILDEAAGHIEDAVAARTAEVAKNETLMGSKLREALNQQAPASEAEVTTAVAIIIAEAEVKPADGEPAADPVDLGVIGQPGMSLSPDALTPADHNPANMLFGQIFNSVATEIDFIPAWADDEGLFRPAVEGEYALKFSPTPRDDQGHLTVAEMVCCRDEGGRRLVFVGTRLGPIVVFDRFQGAPGVYWYSATDAFEKTGMLPHEHKLDVDVLYKILGNGGAGSQNIGHLVEAIYDASIMNTMG
jgi:hypothetical protein